MKYARRLSLAGLVVLVCCSTRSGLGKGSWTKVWDLERTLAQSREGNAKLKARNDALDAEVRDLKQGTEAIEEHARGSELTAA